MTRRDGVRAVIRRGKQGALRSLAGAGVLGRVRDSGWRRRRLLILCYHGISVQDEHEWNPALFMPPEGLRARLEMLRQERYNVLPLGDALQRLRAGALPPRSVAITFDDGEYGFYARAFPLLREFGFPATVYLTTHYADRRLPVFELICSYMLWKKAGGMVRVNLGGTERRLDLRNEEGQRRALQEVVEFAERGRFSSEQKDGVAADLAGALGIDYAQLRTSRILQLVNHAEVKELSGAGVDIQLHTHRHRSPRSQAEYQKEIRDNRASIQAKTRQLPVHFCYPSGEYAAEFLPWLSAEGVVSATTCSPGLASAETDPLLLPRLVDHTGLSAIEFRAWLSGLASLLPHKRRYGLNV